MGIPLNSSSKIAPSDHMSYDHGFKLLNRLIFDELDWVRPEPLISRYYNTSGERYSGVVAVILVAPSN